MTSRDRTREHIVDVAARLLAEGGRDAVSTRAVSLAAGVQAPTLYRLFGDKRGLLDAVAAHGLALYVSGKTARSPHGDPVDALRAGWDLHVGFGLAHPVLYALMYGDPRPDGPPSPAAARAAEVLAEHVHRIARAGRLRVGEPLAAHLVHAGGSGTTLSLLAVPEEQRDPALSHAAREAVLAAIITDEPPSGGTGAARAAIALRSALPQTGALTASERALLAEWLDRIAASA